MCLLFIAWKAHPSYKLILAANRDEYYDRPTAPAEFWKDAPGLLAGRDLRAQGTWLGITTGGRIAAVTNYRDPKSLKSKAPSRGRLVTDYLRGKDTPEGYLEKLVKRADQYNGYNLIFGSSKELFWYSNRGQEGRLLSPGIYGVSNHLLDTPWPKVARGKEAFRQLLGGSKGPEPEDLFHLLSDRTPAPDESLPQTGVGLEWERILSPIFITSPIYGTRSSTLIYIDQQDRVIFIERSFDSDPDHPKTVRFEFQIER